jgi:hypothetical protein
MPSNIFFLMLVLFLDDEDRKVFLFTKSCSLVKGRRSKITFKILF